MMKKLLFTLAAGAFLSAGSIAQTNGNFESWSGSGASIQIDGWGTLNGFTLVGAPQTTFQETVDVGDSMFSPRIVTDYWFGATSLGASSDTVSGFVTIGGSPPGDLGIPYTDKLESITFMIKADLEANDTGGVFIQLSHWDDVLDSQMVIAQALVPVFDSSGWFSVTAPPFYFDPVSTPDTLQIICVSSLGTILGSPLPIIGSSISVDAFVITLPPVGVEEVDIDVAFSVYPNPSSDYVVINNGSPKSKMDVEMMDINGKIVRSYTDVSGGEMTIDGNGLARGSYFIKVTSGGKQVIRQVIFQ